MICRIWSILGIVLLIGSCTAEPHKGESESDRSTWFDPIEKDVIYGLRLGFPITGSQIILDSLSTRSIDSKFSPAVEIVHDQIGGICTYVKVVYQCDTLPIEPLFSHLQTHLDSLYGRTRPTTGYSTWKTSSARGLLVEVELIDGHRLFDRPEIICMWNEKQDQRYAD